MAGTETLTQNKIVNMPSGQRPDWRQCKSRYVGVNKG